MIISIQYYNIDMEKKNIFKKNLFFTLLIFVLMFSSCKPPVENKTLFEKLNDLEGVTATEVEILEGFAECYQIFFTQPVDHNNPNGATFMQSFFLSHREDTAPTIFHTTGYGASRNSEKELTSLLQGNQILVPNRYYPEAMPPAGFEFLSAWQMASDQHRIKETFKTIYAGKWISTGKSMGGVTALLYRYYFPDDVDATVAYVAPLMKEIDDSRSEIFFENVGTKEYREKIKVFQQMILLKRDELMPLIENHIQEQGYEFSILSVDAAFEYSVVEFIFYYWGQDPDVRASIPTEQSGESNDELLGYLLKISPLSGLTDQRITYLYPFGYIGLTELGSTKYIYSHLKDLLETVKKPSNRDFAPPGIEIEFNPDLMPEVISWLQNQGEKIIYIYGGNDFWSSFAAIPDPNLDSLMIMQPGANHGVRINDLDEREMVIQTLNRWLDVSISH